MLLPYAAAAPVSATRRPVSAPLHRSTAPFPIHCNLHHAVPLSPHLFPSLPTAISASTAPPVAAKGLRLWSHSSAEHSAASSPAHATSSADTEGSGPPEESRAPPAGVLDEEAEVEVGPAEAGNTARTSSTAVAMARKVRCARLPAYSTPSGSPPAAGVGGDRWAGGQVGEGWERDEDGERRHRWERGGRMVGGRPARWAR